MNFPIDEVNDITPLETFYARNPEELTDEDLEELVKMHRDERAKLLAKPRRKKAEKK